MSRKLLVPFQLPADPTLALHAATKQYVDANSISQAAADTRYVNTAGDTMSGALSVPNLNGQGTNNQLGINNSWLPYSDGFNYYNSDFHAFRNMASSATFLQLSTNLANFLVPIRVPQLGSVSLASANHAFQIGTDNTHNIAFDYNVMQSRFNGMANVLNINPLGGTVNIGASPAGTLNIGDSPLVSNSTELYINKSSKGMYLDANVFVVRGGTASWIAYLSEATVNLYTPITFTNNLTGSTPANFKHTPTNNAGYINIVNSELLGMQFPKWHNLLAWSGYSPVAEQWNGTAWSAHDARNLFDTNGQIGAVICDATYSKWRCTWSGLTVSYLSQILIAFSYTENPTRDILIEVSPDGTTWTTFNSITGVTWTTFPYIIPLNGAGGAFNNGTDSYLRITITKTGAGSIAATAIEGYTWRWGNQGQGPEVERAYQVDGDRTVTFQPRIASGTALIARQFTGQTANILSIKNAAGADLAAFDSAGRLNMGGLRIMGVSTPSAVDDAANKAYVDANAGSEVEVSATDPIGTKPTTELWIDTVTNPPAAPLASAISFSPTGTIAATNVQSAIAEVALEAPRGIIAWKNGSVAGQAINTTPATIYTLAASLISGRMYELKFTSRALQAGTGTWVRFTYSVSPSTGAQISQGVDAYSYAPVPGGYNFMNWVGLITCTATATYTFQILASCSAGTTGAVWTDSGSGIWIKDIGPSIGSS